MNQINYQKQLDQIIHILKEESKVPRLLLHSCCAPCSSYVLEYLSQHFNITIFFYNPNIFPPEEYSKRVLEQQRLINEMTSLHPISFMESQYEPSQFYNSIRGLEHLKEGQERCFLCYELRLREAAIYASNNNFDYFTTTLTISPLKNAVKLNEIGNRLGKEYNLSYLPSDFKKRNGYKRSVELSLQYGLYRQDYCGCIFSKQEREINQLSVVTIELPIEPLTEPPTEPQIEV